MATHKDYEALVAAHLLRSPQFASAYGPLILKVEGRFFEEFFLRDPVLHGLKHFMDTGVLLPPAALKADASLFGRNGASQDNYDLEIDRVFGVDDGVLARSKEHVESKLVGEVQSRLLLQADLHGQCSPASLGNLWKLLDEIRTLDAVRDGEARRFSRSFLETLREPPVGIPTGVGPLDAVLGGGPTAGETVLFFGRYSIGKSILLNHAVRYGAEKGKVVLLWAVGDGSQKVLELRLAKGFLGWTRDQLLADPEKAYKAFMDRYGDLRLYTIWSPPSKTGKAQICAQLDRIENDAGRKVELLAMDYSEKRALGRDWNQVVAAYDELRNICAERGMVGLDVAQENQSGQISYFNLLKDADVGVQLTVLPPNEWRRKQKSMKEKDASPPEIPSKGPVWGEIIRAREGATGSVFELWVDRDTGRVEERRKGGEE